MKQTILFGNGINLLSSDVFNWNNVLKGIRNGALPYNDVPNTLQYEDILLELLNTGNCQLSRIQEDSLKTDVVKYLSKIPIGDNTKQIYDKLFEIPADFYLTTNYDVAYEDVIRNRGFRRVDLTEERTYNMRRRYNWSNLDNRSFLLWSIHGNVNNMQSLMLGFDHYCGTIVRIYDYINWGTYKWAKVNDDYRKYINGGKDKLYMPYHIKNVNTDNFMYWVDTFFLSDVHIIGLGMSFDEIDLWWLLNKRKRMMMSSKSDIKNRIYMYGFVKNEIAYMLKSCGVDLSQCTEKEPTNRDEWNELYKLSLAHMRQNIELMGRK